VLTPGPLSLRNPLTRVVLTPGPLSLRNPLTRVVLTPGPLSRRERGPGGEDHRRGPRGEDHRRGPRGEDHRRGQGVRTTARWPGEATNQCGARSQRGLNHARPGANEWSLATRLLLELLEGGPGGRLHLLVPVVGEALQPPHRRWRLREPDRFHRRRAPRRGLAPEDPTRGL